MKEQTTPMQNDLFQIKKLQNSGANLHPEIVKIQANKKQNRRIQVQ